MNYKKLKLGIVGLATFLPTIALAAGDLISFIGTIGRVLSALVPIMVTLALIYFIYGLAEYVAVSGNEAKKVEGKNIMIYGTIAMFFIVSIWGIVQFIGKTIGVTENATVNSPKIPR